VNDLQQPDGFEVNEDGRLQDMERFAAARTGFDFVGWYTHPIGGELVTEDTVFTSYNTSGRFVDVWARWVSNVEGTFTITLNAWNPPAHGWPNTPDGLMHTDAISFRGPTTIATDSSGRIVGNLPNFGWENELMFMGWIHTPDGRWNYVQASAPFTEDTTIHAQWDVAVATA
jgi:hypothetical protein